MRRQRQPGRPVGNGAVVGSRFYAFVMRLLGDRRGVSTIEYGLLLAAILLAAAAGYRALGKKNAAAIEVAEATFHGDTQWNSGNGAGSVGGGSSGSGGGSVGGGGSSGSGGGSSGGGSAPGDTICDGRSCGLPGGGCFVAGTLVATPSGERPIESLHVGDLVLARSESESDDAVSARAIATTYVRPGHSLVDVHVETADGTLETIRSTPDHLYFAQLYGWVAAADLAPGETLSDSSGREIRVTKVVPIPQEAPVYNFEVDVDHTYFVGHSAAWVHNPQGCGDGPPIYTGPVTDPNGQYAGAGPQGFPQGPPQGGYGAQPQGPPGAPVKVLGRLDDTKNHIGKAGQDVLKIPNWTVEKNDAWVKAGIDGQQNFYLASPTDGNLVQTTGKYAGLPTIYARELSQLQAAGYVRVGDYMVHPANLPR